MLTFGYDFHVTHCKMTPYNLAHITRYTWCEYRYVLDEGLEMECVETMANSGVLPVQKLVRLLYKVWPPTCLECSFSLY
jgi:hypothetical protein